MSLTVTVQQKIPGVFTIHPVGAIDSSTYKILEDEINALLKGIPEAIIFDMELVNYMSSAGVWAIFKVQKEMKLRGGSIILMKLQPQVKKVFDIINALPSIQVFSSIEELDLYLDQMQRKMKE